MSVMKSIMRIGSEDEPTLGSPSSEGRDSPEAAYENHDDNDNDNSNSSHDSESLHLSTAAGTSAATAAIPASYLQSAQFVELVACLVFTAATATFFLLSPSPRQRPIPFQLLESSGEYVRNLTNNESFDGETVSTALLFILSTMIPLLLQLAISFVCARYWSVATTVHMPYYDVHATACVYLLAVSLNTVVTEAIKVYVGYLRPIFYEECEPDDTYQECTAEDGGDTIRKSFPSGHASMAFCGLTLFAMYIHTRFGLVQSRRRRERLEVLRLASTSGAGEAATWRRLAPECWELDVGARLVSVLSLLPLALAVFISASRIVDNKHFPADVVGGAVLGTAVAAFVSQLWF